MATRPIVPRANGEGSLGVSTAGSPKYWGDVFTNRLNNADAKAMASRSTATLRAPFTNYSSDAKCVAAGLPANFLLVCTAGGTTANADITLPATIADTATFVDGTVTWQIQELVTTQIFAFRQPSTAVTAASIVFCPGLPSGFYLECSVAGTTDSGAITLPSPIIENATVTDGTVTWKIRKISDITRTEYENALNQKVDKITFNDLFRDTAAAHNCFYRGKDLTSYFESGEMSAAIADGSFRDIYPGDYIIKTVTINGTTYADQKFIVMDLDYFQPWSFGDTYTHHIVMMPEGALGTQYMNSTNITTGGYVGSYMHATHIPKVNTGIVAAFGSAHVLSHQEQLTNTVDTSKPSGAGSGFTGCATGWTAVSNLKCCLCSENMVYGGRVWGSAMDTGCATKQLAAFRHNQQLRKTTSFWLRAVSTSATFALANSAGNASSTGASAAYGVRPYFLLA